MNINWINELIWGRELRRRPCTGPISAMKEKRI